MSKQMNWRKLGFTQRKPTLPGVYFVSSVKPLPRIGARGPERLAQGWDIAEVMFWAGSYDNVHENLESRAHWRLKLLSGIECAWRRGMWIKGPITPEPNP